tara:strand:+ start:5666 stop:6352 length:687 start_codon:yes stop_codon:yes gene_type:complete
MTICIIPARSGSKRIKNKNIKKINQIPLIGIVINIAKKSKLFSRIIVSTDSPKIALISKKYGAEAPFLRSKKLSDDFTPTHKVIIDVINKVGSAKEEFHFCIYPTSVLIDTSDLKKALFKIKKTKANFICPIAKFESSPFRSFFIKKTYIQHTWPLFKLKRSQDLKDLYYDTGSFYIYRTSSLLKIKNQNFLPNKSTYITLKKKLIDVNYPKDLKALKKKLKKNRYNK